MTYPEFSKISFVKSITDVNNAPDPRLPEVAFAGRSNVGKSSLLNALFNRRNFVKTSSTPGKTRLINYFNVSDMFYCVDLPGYGYAKIPRQEAHLWQKMMEDFITQNQYLKLIYVLIDSRRDIMENDREMLSWLSYIKIPYKIILSKTDKISKNDLAKQKQFYQNVFPDIKIIPFSIRNKFATTSIQKDILNVVS